MNIKVVDIDKLEELFEEYISYGDEHCQRNISFGTLEDLIDEADPNKHKCNSDA